MAMLSEIWAFLWAVINNWAGYATGGLIVALAWLWSTVKQQAIPKKPALALAGLFLFFAFFNAWREQYEKVLQEAAYLDAGGLRNFYPGDPFPIGQTIRLQIVWANMGKSIAKQTLPNGRIYFLADDRLETQNAMIRDWKSRYQSLLDKPDKPSSPIFAANTQRPIDVYAEGFASMTPELRRQIFGERAKQIFVVGSVRFKDAIGEHEAHTCFQMVGLFPSGEMRWNQCLSDYLTQVDIPKSKSVIH